MVHPLEQVGGGIERHDAPLFQHCDALAKRFGLLQVVRRQDDRVAVPVEPLDELPQRLAKLDVDARGRFVEHDHGGLVHQGLRHEHPPLHPARERAHVDFGFGSEVEVPHHLVDPRAIVAHSEIARLEAQGLAHGEERIEYQFLRDDPEGATRGAIVGAHIMAHHPGRAPVGARETRENAYQGGLTGPIGSEQPEKLSLPDLEVDPRERQLLAEALVDVADFDRGRHAGGRPREGSARSRL